MKRIKLKNTCLDIENIYYNRNKLLDELFYKPNDTFTFRNGYYIAGGLVTGSTKEIRFELILPKSLKNIKQVIINSLVVDVRRVNGGYLFNNVDVAKTSGVSIGSSINSDSAVRIVLNSTTAYDTTNNTPCGVEIRSVNLTLK